MTNHSELFILQKLKEGDLRALEVIYNQYYPNLCKYLLLLFKNQQLAEQIANDIFIYLWEHRNKVEIKSSLESYLYAAGKYKALNKIRNDKRRDEITQLISESSEKHQDGPDILLESKELESIIENAIKMLPPRCQEIFRLSREEELSHKEIAELLGISINTVEGQMNIAFKKLRKVLRPFYIKIVMMV